MLSFHALIGDEQIKDQFQKASANNKVSHAYILTGEAGMGRKSLANAFAVSYTHLVECKGIRELDCETDGSSR